MKMKFATGASRILSRDRGVCAHGHDGITASSVTSELGCRLNTTTTTVFALLPYVYLTAHPVHSGVVRGMPPTAHPGANGQELEAAARSSQEQLIHGKQQPIGNTSYTEDDDEDVDDGTEGPVLRGLLDSAEMRGSLDHGHPHSHGHTGHHQHHSVDEAESLVVGIAGGSGSLWASVSNSGSSSWSFL